MTENATSNDKVRDYVLRLTPPARSRLLVELERLQVAGNDMPGSQVLLAELRAEFRKGSKAHDRVKSPSRYFFQPLEPMLVNCSAEHANSGQISRGSLATIWEWIEHVLLPAMTREYDTKMRQVVVASSPHEAERIADVFRSKIIKCLEGALATPDGIERTCGEFAIYTSSRAILYDLAKMHSVLQARETLATFSAALPRELDAFEGELLAKVRGLLDACTTKHPEAMPFALTMVAKRLKVPWQLIRLATKVAASRNATKVAATPYAISVSMVLDHLDDRRLALSHALKNGQTLIAKDILIDIHAIERALRVRIDLPPMSDWGRRLDEMMKAVAADLEGEIHNIPDKLHHVLASRAIHRNGSVVRHMSHLLRKGRDALIDGTTHCKIMIGFDRK